MVGVGLPPGVERLPADWTTAKLKHVASVESSNVDKKSYADEVPVKLCNYTDVYYNERITRAGSFMRATATFGEIEKFSLCRGDILLTKDSEHWSDIAVPALVADDLDGVLCGYHLAQVRPDAGKVDSGFLYYCFAAEVLNRQFQVAANGITRFGLPIGELRGAVLPIPPFQVQLAIADFLDEKTAAIDALIAKKQRLIDLIEEKRQAAITRAVTKGLDPDVPMKDSGVEWLGEVPAHWKVAPLYARYAVQLGKMLSPEAADGVMQAPYVRNANVQWGRLVLDDLREMSFSPADRNKFALRPGDLLVCEGGEVGRTAIWRGELADCFYQKAIHRLRAFGRDLPSFFMFVMRTAAHRGAFLAEGNQSTIIHLTAEKLRRHRFPFPPLAEQRRIAQHLQEEMSTCDSVVGRQRTVIERLREYRQTLISAAVTGQIDVRARATRAEEILEEVTA